MGCDQGLGKRLARTKEICLACSVTNTGSEKKEVAHIPSPRRLMRVLTVFATVLVWVSLATLLTEVDLIAEDDWIDRLASLFAYLVISYWAAVWTWRAWRKPSGKSDRVALMTCLLVLISIPSDFFFSFMPEQGFMFILSTKLLAVFPGFVWCYRRLEQSWTTDGDMLPLVEGNAWPSDRHFLVVFCVIMSLELLLILSAALEGVVSEDIEVAICFLVPPVAAGSVFWIGRKVLAKQSPASEATQKQGV
jgi:hypothetical protein